ncbi:class I SAM-dependent methyltransferase [Wangella sp. NEAU-J3]|nr:class I SAM-dependent methyltransferase [Jidongwangia harbinensis]
MTGVDASADMIAVAGRAATATGLHDRISFQVADVAALPCDDHSVDVVVSTLSLHHWPDPAAAAAEFARVPRPVGRVMIYDVRFAALGRAVAALGARPEFRPGGVRRAPVRVRWYPVTPFARITAGTPR